ncbi:MAG: cobyrinate a,c-diamide synthase [Lachnospiraceae bacterium]|nr:cobyrinate a,c-diamide synthase [Lachnospiraceae bacterium]
MRKLHIPRFMIAAPKSGSGKTFITCGILRLLQRKGLKVSAFKCGPDYIDPMFHQTVLGLPSKNLDTFFTDEGTTRTLLAESAEKGDIAVIEGVMGYFDGMGTSGFQASSYDLATKTRTPVILVIEAKGMSRSVVPQVKGFLEYGQAHNIKGVILNRVSAGMFPVMKKWIEEETGARVLGFLPAVKDALWESRHLGLVQPNELKTIQDQVDRVADALSENLDYDGLMKLAEGAAELEAEEISVTPLSKPVRIAVAKDEAFSFYYEDNLNLMRKFGAEIRYFSPIHDKEIPEADGILFGGGYPELYGAELSENKEMLEAVKAAADAGTPILAECGGFMYLQKGLRDKDRTFHELVGALDGETYMTDKLVRFGYLELVREEHSDDNEAASDRAASASKEGAGIGGAASEGEEASASEGAASGSKEGAGIDGAASIGTDGSGSCGLPYLKPGQVIRGHEFHYFDSTDNGSSCTARKPNRKRQWACMAEKGKIFAGFPHLYYYSDPEFLRNFLSVCAESRVE